MCHLCNAFSINYEPCYTHVCNAGAGCRSHTQSRQHHTHAESRLTFSPRQAKHFGRNTLPCRAGKCTRALQTHHQHQQKKTTTKKTTNGCTDISRAHTFPSILGRHDATRLEAAASRLQFSAFLITPAAPFRGCVCAVLRTQPSDLYTRRPFGDVRCSVFASTHAYSTHVRALNFLSGLQVHTHTHRDSAARSRVRRGWQVQLRNALAARVRTSGDNVYFRCNINLNPHFCHETRKCASTRIVYTSVHSKLYNKYMCVCLPYAAECICGIDKLSSVCWCAHPCTHTHTQTHQSV